MNHKPEFREGWLVADGCKLAKPQDGLVLSFHDKDKRRSELRGTDQLDISLVELLLLMAEAIEFG